MQDVTLSVVDASSAQASQAMSQYFDELAALFPEGVDAAGALAQAGDDYNPPHGFFVLAGATDSPVACGAVHFLDEARGEIKRMWVSPSYRGQGLASRLLACLEDLVRRSGRRIVVPDTNRALTEAAALYVKRGYVPIERYNDNPNAHLWFRKDLD